ncbi:MAG TPA: hypothetical protein VIK77_08165 [Tissierellaceae bacterium]
MMRINHPNFISSFIKDQMQSTGLVGEKLFKHISKNFPRMEITIEEFREAEIILELSELSEEEVIKNKAIFYGDYEYMENYSRNNY